MRRSRSDPTPSSRASARRSRALLLREMPARLLLSSLFGSNPLGGSVASAAYTLGSLSYARADELSADLGAVLMLAGAQVDPDGMIQCFRRSTSTSSRDSRLMNYISTHPSNAERIEALEAEAEAAAGTVRAWLRPLPSWSLRRTRADPDPDPRSRNHRVRRLVGQPPAWPARESRGRPAARPPVLARRGSTPYTRPIPIPVPIPESPWPPSRTCRELPVSWARCAW